MMEFIGARNDNAGGQPGEVSKAKNPQSNSISTLAWRLAYSLEDARRSHEVNRRHARRLACCIGLAALRLLTGGLHHV